MGLRVIDIGGWIRHDGGGSFHKSWLLLLGLYGELTPGKVFSLDTLDAGQPVRCTRHGVDHLSRTTRAAKESAAAAR